MPILTTTIPLSATPEQACLLATGAIVSVTPAPGGATLTLGSGNSHFLAGVDASNAHLAATPAGALVFAAAAYGVVDFGDLLLGSEGMTSLLVVLFDAAETIAWSRAVDISSSPEVTLTALSTSADGKVFLGGLAGPGFDLGPGAAPPETGAFVATLGAGGATSWVLSFPGCPTPLSLVPGPDSVCIVGFANDRFTLGETRFDASPGAVVGWVAFVDQAGTLSGARVIDAGPGSEARFVAASLGQNGLFRIGGYARSGPEAAGTPALAFEVLPEPVAVSSSVVLVLDIHPVSGVLSAETFSASDGAEALRLASTLADRPVALARVRGKAGMGSSALLAADGLAVLRPGASGSLQAQVLVDSSSARALDLRVGGDGHVRALFATAAPVNPVGDAEGVIPGPAMFVSDLGL